MQEVEVKPYTRYAGKFVNIGNFAYNLNSLPTGLTLVANAIDEETEEKMITLIDSNNSSEIKRIMNCIAKEISPELGCKLNDYYWSSLKPGEGMYPEQEDYRYYNPCVVVFNLGSDIEMVFNDVKTRRQYPVMLPRRSMFLLKGQNYQRVITKKFTDKVGNDTYQREKRYALVFKSMKN
jgi:hypothetical protein